MSRVPPATPLRRVSHASLYALARSQTGAPPDDPDASSYDPSAPASIAFLGPALDQLADEADALVANIRQTAAATDALERFNEGFGAYLYAMRMNAFATYFPQAPTEVSYALAERRREEDARRAEEEERARAEAEARAAAEAAEAARAAAMPPVPDRTQYPDASNFTFVDMSPGDTTVLATKSAATSSAGPPKKKVGGKKQLSAKEKKERGALIEKVISLLPLAYRGNDPSLRRQMETVIEKMLNDPTRGYKLMDLTAQPDLNEARVRKCVLALSGAKIVKSDNTSGFILYRWLGPPDR